MSFLASISGGTSGIPLESAKVPSASLVYCVHEEVGVTDLMAKPRICRASRSNEMVSYQSIEDIPSRWVLR
jgi:hypothetical protein